LYYYVNKKHRTNYPNPITLEKGDMITILDEYSGEKEWKNWLFCEKAGKRRRGWVPKQVLSIENGKGVLKEDYCARELNVDCGEILEKIKVLNGWAWCKRFREYEFGWIPVENIKLIKDNRDFDSLYKEAIDAYFSGWDFSYLNDRMINLQYLNWSYKRSVEFHLERTQNLLDMETGGGEFLKSLKNLPREVYATEGYSPNIPIAKKNLDPLGIILIPKSGDAPLGFENDSLDLIINRHGSYNPPEIHSILKKNGFFITQQVGEMDNIELNHFFNDKTRDKNKWCLSGAVNELEKEGFKIFVKREQFIPTLFTDIGAVTYYLKIITWQIPDLDLRKPQVIEKLRELDKIIKKSGGLITNQHRFFIIAYKE